MPEGPLGGPRPFLSDNKTVLVLAGIDGQFPPPDIQISIEATMESEMNGRFGFKPSRDTVSITTERDPTDQQKEELGDRTLHVQQYEVFTPWEEISQKQINAIHNEVVDVLNKLDFNITGTKVTVV